MIDPIASRSVVPGARSPRPERGSRGGAGSPNSRVPVLGGVHAQGAPGVGAREPPARGDQRRSRATAPSASGGTASAPAAADTGCRRTRGRGRSARLHVNASVPRMPARLFPMLSAEDFAASLRFYGDLLGGVEAYRFPEDEPVFVTLQVRRVRARDRRPGRRSDPRAAAAAGVRAPDRAVPVRRRRRRDGRRRARRERPDRARAGRPAVGRADRLRRRSRRQPRDALRPAAMIGQGFVKARRRRYGHDAHQDRAARRPRPRRRGLGRARRGL